MLDMIILVTRRGWEAFGEISFLEQKAGPRCQRGPPPPQKKKTRGDHGWIVAGPFFEVPKLQNKPRRCGCVCDVKFGSHLIWPTMLASGTLAGHLRWHLRFKRFIMVHGCFQISPWLLWVFDAVLCHLAREKKQQLFWVCHMALREMLELFSEIITSRSVRPLLHQPNDRRELCVPFFA